MAETPLKPSVDIADETFVVAAPPELAPCLTEQTSLRRFWPDLDLRVLADRGDEGRRWAVSGALHGWMEIWLEPVLDGTVVHYFLRAEPNASNRPRGEGARTRRYRAAGKRFSFELKRRFERDRPIGRSR